MRPHIITPRFALAAVLCVSSAFVHADVLICRNAGGAITYTNNQCPDDSHPDGSMSGQEMMYHAEKPSRPVMLQTRWAEPIVHRHNNPDVATIRSARAALKLMDQDRLEQRLRLAASD